MFTQGQSCHNIVLPFVNIRSIQIFHMVARTGLCVSMAFGVFNQELLTLCLVFDLEFENKMQ